MDPLVVFMMASLSDCFLEAHWDILMVKCLSPMKAQNWDDLMVK